MKNSLPHYIEGRWVAGSGEPITSYNPATLQSLWIGQAAQEEEIEKAVAAAKKASKMWAEKDVEERYSYLKQFEACLKKHQSALATAISEEMGKPLWEALTEVQAMIGKIDISYAAYHQRCPVGVKGAEGPYSITRHKPHGTVAVFGPFNFPGHLPNGHIIPALLAGNCLVFKPSELTPRVGELMVKLWEESALPPGVLNLVQGGMETGELLAQNPDIDGILFTGSWKTGLKLSKLLSHHPEKILALEMGGNNPLVIGEISDPAAAAYLTIQSAFITSGQRCSCARRLILPETPNRELFISTLIAMTQEIKSGFFDEQPEPFMGPLINRDAADKLLQFQRWLIENGGSELVGMRLKHNEGSLLTPGIIDVTEISERPDEEFFGPLLQLIRVETFADAIEEANHSDYGLTAALLSDREEEYALFLKKIRAGVINWNNQTTGASSSAPFGGIGKSGNHRPSAFYAADYCAYPVASLESQTISPPKTCSPGISYPLRRSS